MLCYTQDLAVASTAEGLLVAVAGAPGVVLYCLEKDDSQPGPGAWRMSQRARLCPMWAVCAVSMSADGSTLAAAALGSQLHVWDLQPGLHAIRLELRVLSLGSCCSNLHGFIKPVHNSGQQSRLCSCCSDLFGSTVHT